MANRRILIKRRKAVRNIRKITRTMQLIATTRFQVALTRATASKPYTEKLAELVADLSGVSEDVQHTLLKTPENTMRSAMVVLSSNRGLCGGYNSNVLRTALTHLDASAERGVETDIHMVGKKGVTYFRFLNRAIVAQDTEFDDSPAYEQVEPIANSLMERFQRGEIGSAFVGYMKFYSAGKQRPEVMQLLPLSGATGDDETTSGAAKPDYEFSPAPMELLDELLPATVRIRLFQCFLEATVSEHIGRMVAMKAATDAAGDMITSLTRKYNRARQTHITMELLDIIGGASALE